MKEKITLEQAEDFFYRIVWENCSEAYVADMLIYLLKSISDMALEKGGRASDFCDDLTNIIFNNITQYAEQSRRKYIEEIENRIKTFGYDVTGRDEELKKIKREVYGEKVLDLSNHSTKEDECLDLAKHLSAVMLDKNTPAAIYNALADELTKQNIEPAVYYSPEHIASMICEGSEK